MGIEMNCKKRNRNGKKNKKNKWNEVLGRERRIRESERN